MSDPWIEYWSGRALPSLKATRERLLPLMRRPERTSPGEIADIVLRDPLLAAQVLRVANQRVRSGLAADVVSVESAVMLFGVAPFFERFCRGPTIDELMAGDPARLRAYRAAILEVRFAARLARDYAQRRFDARLDEVYIAALLQGISPLLALVAGLDPATPAPMPRVTELLASWRLPEAIIDLTRESGDGQARLNLQQAALRLAAALQLGWWQPQVQRELHAIAALLQQQEGAVWETATALMLSYATRDYAEAAAMPAARWLPMLPGSWPRPPAPAEAPAQALTPAKPAPLPVSPAAVPAARTVQPDPMVERLSALHHAGKERAPANQIMSLAVRALAEGLAMRRIVLALLTPDGLQLRARFCQGAGESDPIRRLEISLAPPTLFSRLLERPQCIRVEAPHRGEVKALLPPELLRQIGHDAFCAMSIFVHDKPLGILFADRITTISDGDYQQVRRVCQLTSQALSASAGRPGEH
ncbi:HDOD domain-containing protein [Chitinolyticbacter albus]|uniref:HDOD domain-containing protein n=1 Tax=Chitinolyticbacter albus TaxID=2961951 RepID=UPI00210A216B|nr:HDOD domain-containing protein [Chitinolyticbacter albus]